MQNRSLKLLNTYAIEKWKQKKRHKIENSRKVLALEDHFGAVCVCSLCVLMSHVVFYGHFVIFVKKTPTFQVGIDRRERRMRILLAFCHYIFQCSGEIYIFLCVCSGCCCCYGDTFRDMCYIKLGGARSVLDLLNLSKMIIT